MKRFLTLGLIIVLSATGFAQPVNPFPKTINVNGSASVEVIPDEIYVLVTLREYDKKGSGKIDLEKIKAAFLEKCRSIGLADSAVTIASYEGAWIAKKRKKDEMFASIAYQVKFSSSKKMDELVYKLDDDATQNFQISNVSHSKLSEFRKQLKIQAVKAAKEKRSTWPRLLASRLAQQYPSQNLMKAPCPW